MKKAIILFSILCFSIQSSMAQDNTFDISKGDYKILKFDVLNLMGLGVQKLHLGYEISPMRQNQNNLPTIQFNLTAPFNSLNEDLDVDYGIEGGVELRFYQRKRNRPQLLAEGFYMGVALDGGYTSFSSNTRYYKSNYNDPGDYEITQMNDYERIRTGISFLLGGQAKLGERLFFDGNIGIGWSNVNVTDSGDNEAPAGYNASGSSLNPFFLHFEEGKGQRFYMPLSFGVGYNFGKL